MRWVTATASTKTELTPKGRGCLIWRILLAVHHQYRHAGVHFCLGRARHTCNLAAERGTPCQGPGTSAAQPNFLQVLSISLCSAQSLQLSIPDTFPCTFTAVTRRARFITWRHWICVCVRVCMYKERLRELRGINHFKLLP